jgi:hypothetical protein
MKLWKFDDYDKYLQAQINGSIRRPNRRPTCDQYEVDKLAECLARRSLAPKNMVCHGARCGTEVRLFQAKFPDLSIFGTDVAPRCPEVIDWDFNKQKPEWVGAMDIVYSNSLDHSPDPAMTVKTWLEQLNPTGLLVLQWNAGHAKIATWENLYAGGDCFGSSLNEFIDIVDTVGTVQELVFLGRVRKWGFRTLVIAKPQGVV